MHKHCQWVLTQSRCWQLCSKWKQGSRPTTWTTLPIKWYVYNNTFLRLWRHTHMCACMHKDSPYTHVHTSMQVHSQSKGNELMESNVTTLGAKAYQLVVGQMREMRPRQGKFGIAESRERQKAEHVTNSVIKRKERVIIIALFGSVFLPLCQSDRVRQGMEK